MWLAQGIGIHVAESYRVHRVPDLDVCHNDLAVVYRHAGFFPKADFIG
jgi:hypothetical protein